VNLPTSIRVGWRDIHIVELGWQQSDADERFGDYDSNHGIIRVATHYGRARAAATLLHETLHAAWDAAHLDAKEAEERAVTCLADVLSQVWRDNPEFVAFVSAGVGGEVV